MAELKRAIRRLKRKGAPGADDIPPSFIKELGPIALTELLSIYNESFTDADLPQSWRHSIIIPLLKAGKPASEVESYRPVSLTSCLVKLLERLISSRLYTLAENRGWFAKQQAGFRKGRSCEDQVIKLIQNISNGFQKKPKPMRTVMALLDYTKAFDRTWREKLFLKLHDLGVPLQMIRWISAFLQTRTAEALVNGTLSKRVRMKQGLPQGSVLSPLLFIIFINDILSEVPSSTESSLFADDAALYALDSNREAAEAKLQLAVSAVERWSILNKLDLNIKKSCTFFFSTDPGDATWRPNITLLGSRMRFGEGEKERNPKFLGITLDRTLCFKDHVTDVCNRVNNRCRVLLCLASRSWGWKKRNLRRIFITTQRSILDYAAAAWQPWLSPTQFKRLETAQNRCLRIVTGQYANTDLELLRLEANVPSYRTHSNRLTATAYEKGLRYLKVTPGMMPSHNPTSLTNSRNEAASGKKGNT
jgi:hypothetical protein